MIINTRKVEKVMVRCPRLDKEVSLQECMGDGSRVIGRFCEYLISYEGAGNGQVNCRYEIKKEPK